MGDSQLTTTEQLESIWALGGLTIGKLAKKVWAGINDNDLLGLSSELAYSFTLSLFPLLLFLISLFGLFASRGTQLRDNLMFYLQQALPPAAFTVVSKTITEVTVNSGSGKITFGLGLALFTASGGIAAMMSGLNYAYSVRETRPWYKVRIIALVLTIALAVLVVAALALVLAGGVSAQWLGVGAAFVAAWRILQWVFALFFIMLAFSIIYYYGPDLAEQHWYWITPGSFVGVVLWVAVSYGFRAYLHYFNSYSKTYGSLGAVIILLVWFYVTGFSFLVGGEINAQIEHAAALRGHPEAKAPGEKIAPADKVA